MPKLILFKMIKELKLLFLLVVLFCFPLFGQFLEGPGGEVTINSIQPYVNLNISATNEQITITFTNINTKRENKFFYSPPNGSFITYIKYKKVKSNSANDQLIVLLSDGSIIKLNVFSLAYGGSGYPVHLNGPNVIGSAGYDKIDGDALYMLSTSGVYVSRDSGSTWQIDTVGMGTAYAWDIAVDSSQYVYAATDHGLFIQNPDSNAWHRVSSFTLATNLSKVFIDRKNRIFLASNGGKLFMSTDKGATWFNDSNGLGNGLLFINSFGDDSYGNIYFATSNLGSMPNAIYKSAGGVSSWGRIEQGITSITVNSPTINSIGGDSTLYAGTSFGLYSSTDQGTTWTESNKGIRAETTNGFAEASNGRLITSTALAVYTKDANDTFWIKRFPVNGYEANLPLYQDRMGSLYSIEKAGNYFGRILKSIDNGTTWTYDTLGLSSIKTGIFYADENGGQHIATTQYGSSFYEMIYQKTLNGAWVPDTAGIGSSNYSYARSMSSDNHGMLYISGYFKFQNSSSAEPLTFHKQIPGGSWVLDTGGIGANAFSLMTADKNGTMYGGNNNMLLRRTASGWVTVPFPAQLTGNPSLTAFSFDSSNTLFAAFQHYSYPAGNIGAGVYHSANYGATWSFAGLDSLNVKRLYSYGNIIYAITDRGIYIVNKNGTTAVEQLNQIPLHYELFQNYPNPFNPSTVISYRLSAVSHVTLKVYNVLGREIQTLVNEYKPAGKYSINFDASKLASGVYFYRLTAGDYVQTKKLILLK